MLVLSFNNRCTIVTELLANVFKCVLQLPISVNFHDCSFFLFYFIIINLFFKKKNGIDGISLKCARIITYKLRNEINFESKINN